MFQKITAWVVLVTTLLVPLHTLAGPYEAFGGLLSGANMSVNTPGHFQSQARHVLSGGGTDIHFPNQRTQLISIQPPSLSAGCNGISFHFGGFSFISGEQISKMIQQISQAALGYAVQLAIKTLCPQCASVLEALQKLAQMAAKSSMDSCKIGQKLVDEFAGDLFPKVNSSSADAKGLQESCSAGSSGANESSDWLSAFTESICNSANNAVKWWDDWLQDKPQETKDANLTVKGNTVWVALKALGFDPATQKNEMLFLMSLTGTTIYPNVADTSGEDNPQIAPQYWRPKINDPQDAMHLLMCGRNNGGSSTPALEYCNRVFPNSKFGGSSAAVTNELYDCDTDPNETDRYAMCAVLKDATYSDNLLSEDGFIAMVHSRLQAGVAAIQANEPLPPETIALVNSAPFPLYRMLNLAAVYPNAATELVDSSAVVVAHLLAQTYFTRIIASASKVRKGTSVPPELAQRLRDMLMQIGDMSSVSLVRINQLQTLQQTLVRQIADVNTAIQTQVVSQGLAGNQAFATGVMRGAAQGR